MSNYDILMIVKFLLSTMSYLNSKKFFHRDLKPDNILVKK